jgi:thymidylate kinase
VNVIFLGTDGTGKSSLVHSVRTAIGKEVRTLYLGMGSEGWFFEFAKRLYAVPNGFAKHLLFWYFVFPVEILARRLRAYSRDAHITLIDRFPGSPFLGRTALRSIYRFILPTPDIVVFLHGDPEILARRKPGETTFERTSRDTLKWRRVADGIGPGFALELDTTALGLDECTDQVLRVIEEHKRCG